MSDTKTSWILELVDRITAPMKGMMKTTERTESSVDKVSAALHTMDDEGKKAANNLIKNHKNLQEFIEHTESRIKKNTAALNAWDSTHPLSKKLEVDIEQSNSDLKQYKARLKEIENQLDEIAKKPEPAKVKKNWGEVALHANQAYEAMQKIFDGISFAADITDLRANIQRATDMVGESLDDTTAKVHRLQKVYKEDGMEIVRAANSYSKQMGVSFDDALGLIEEGFTKGANLNGDMLDQMKEYGPQLRAAGISAAEGIAIMTKAAKDGVFSDKALDAIKEANLSLRELGQPQVDALKAIGIEVTDLAGKTSFESVQMIAKAMQGATVQAKQMVITDIFRGAGEDSGLAFIEGLDSVNLDINNIPSVQQAGAGISGWLAGLQSSFATTFGNIAVFGQQFGGVAQWISAGIPIVQALTKVTWLQNIATKALTAGQWLMNVAFNASPLGWIATGLAAVTLGVKYAWDKFEGFRAVIYGLWETFKQVFNNIKGLFAAVFSPIGDAIAAIKEGRWGDAAKAVVQLNPVSVAKRTYDYVKEGGLIKGVSEAYARGDAMGRQSFRDDQKEEQPAVIPGTPDANRPVLDGIIKPTGGKGAGAGAGKAGGKNKLGLDISGDDSAGGGFSSISSGGGVGGGKTVNVTNYITNHFASIASNMDIRKVAEQVVREIDKGLRPDQLSTA